MIVIRVELHSAITGKVQELARATLCNTGEGSHTVGHYVAATLRGRDRARLDVAQARDQATRRGEVRDWPRLRLHVWNLVAEALSSMGYGRSGGGRA